jgi:hypothetical protein
VEGPRTIHFYFPKVVQALELRCFRDQSADPDGKSGLSGILLYLDQIGLRRAEYRARKEIVIRHLPPRVP